MRTGRLEAFSDGVIAILITIMVLELRAPHEATLQALRPLWPVFLSYVLSFVNLGIYWNNHHHLLQATSRVSGAVLWANLHLLFWLSLIPFTTAWLGENEFARVPMALYGVVLLAAGMSYKLLARALLATEEDGSMLRTALASDRKGNLSLIIYVVGVAVSLLAHWLAFALYIFVAVMWFIPDRRIERRLGRELS